MEPLGPSIYSLSEGEQDRAIVDLLPAAREFSRAAVSGFAVGAVCLGGSGRAYLGANMEFPEASPNFTIHAEQAAVVNAWLHGESSISLLAVSAAPCGLCRQFLQELHCRKSLKILLPHREPIALEDLLPMAFELDSDQGGSLMAPSLPWVFSAPPQRGLAKEALKAAQRSYSPYTASPAGAALQCRSGRTFAGALVESGAYNPGLSPLQTALILRNLEGAHQDPVLSAVLVERQRAPVSHWGAFQLLLRALDPGIQPLRRAWGCG